VDEQITFNDKAESSNLSGGTFAYVAQMDSQQLTLNQKVVSSNLTVGTYIRFKRRIMAHEIEMAHTCSNCTKSLFKQKGYDWYASGKKQLGVCLALCDGSPPKCVDESWYVRLIDVNVEYDMVGETYNTHRTITGTCTTLTSLGRLGIVLEKDKYLQLRRTKTEKDLLGISISRYRDLELYGIEKYINGCLDYDAKFYDEWRKNYDWWQVNFPLARRCHRNLTCDLWENNGKRESYAKSIISGHYALEDNKERYVNARIVEDG
jgi:hypothetical protein